MRCDQQELLCFPFCSIKATTGIHYCAPSFTPRTVLYFSSSLNSSEFTCTSAEAFQKCFLCTCIPPVSLSLPFLLLLPCLRSRLSSGSRAFPKRIVWWENEEADRAARPAVSLQTFFFSRSLKRLSASEGPSASRAWP